MNVIILSAIMLSAIILSVIMLNVIILSVVTLCVIMLSVVVPYLFSHAIFTLCHAEPEFEALMSGFVVECFINYATSTGQQHL